MSIKRWQLSVSALCLVLVVAMVTPVAVAKSADTKSVEAAIKKLEMDSIKADMAGQNGSWMKEHNTSDYTMGTSWGAWEANDELQKDAADTAHNKSTRRDISDMKVSVYGNHTAIARYKESYDLMIKGEHRARTILTTDTWVNENGAWKLAASHSSQADQKIGD
ncbi:MAG: nuclear transport factor 2 family protein [Acidobacteriales bacterium]|nr:nuclear transport factor 2 family protein [Terriglobales bacterium]